jgi:serine/threonine-protein kinase
MDTDRNLLFGVLAVQADLIDAGRFVEACSAWVNHQDTPLADVLVARGWLTEADRGNVEKMLERKLEKHGGDAQASPAVRQSQAAVADDEIHRSLAGKTTTDEYGVPPTTDHVSNSPDSSHWLAPSGDRYTLSQLHATGGIGRIWLARDHSLGRDVALKELRPERAAYPSAAARFLKEARITGQLEHPGVVPIYEVGRRPGDQQPFYTMRFVRGRTLAESVADYHRRRSQGEAGELGLRELLTAFVGVCNAVAYAHSRGVLHRDLKPHNVVLGDFGEVIVLDWGLARLMGQPEGDGEAVALEAPAGGEVEQTVQGQVLGTPAYMAPEQAEGRLDMLSPATDVYGLGAILYEILTGQPPFRGRTTDVLHQVLHEAPVPPRALFAGLPRALEAVCLKALAKKPAGRYERARDLAGDIAHWLAGEPVSAYREPWTDRSRRWLRRHRTLAVSGVATLAVAAVALTVATLLLGAKNDQLARANGEEHAANQRERTAREQAQTNFALARDAVEKYLTAVTDDADLKKSDFNKLRTKLLETAVPFYERFVQQHADDPVLEAQRGSAYQRLAGLRQDMGDPQAALAAVEQARSVFARLAGEYPDRHEYGHELGKTLYSLARARFTMGQAAAALEVLRDGERVWQQLLAADPENAEYRAGRALGQNSLGVALHNMGRPDEAETAYKEALALREKLVEEAPASAERRRALSQTLNSLGVLANDRRQLDEALRYHRRALQIREQLATENPNSVANLSELSMTYNNLAAVYSEKADYREAVALFRKAGEAMKQAAQRFPSMPFYRHTQSLYLRNAGSHLEAMGKFTEAEAAYLEAAEVLEKLQTEAPGVVEHRFYLGKTRRLLGGCLTHLGRFDEAKAQLHKALPLLEKACADAPRQTAWPGELGAAYTDFGRLCRDRGDSTASLTWFAKAVEKLTDCLAKNAGLGDVRTFLKDAHAEHAETLDRLGRHAEALPNWDRAIELAGPEQQGVFRCYRLLSEGKPDAALGAALALAGKEDLPADALHQLARVCARASSGDDAARKERGAAGALDLLRRWSARGYDPVESMKHDPAFASVRSREDFRALLAKLEAKTKADTK